MDGPERSVAVSERLAEDPHAHEVGDLLELLAADHHLLVDGVQVLRPAFDVGLDTELFQLLAKGRREIVGPALPLVAASLDELRYLLVRTGMKRLERQVLE